MFEYVQKTELNGWTMQNIIKVSVAIVLMALLGCGQDPAEETTGTIEGVVYGFENGNLIGKAHIFTDPPSSAVTSDTLLGAYKILHVEPGIYRVRAQKTGFDTTSVRISVMAGEKTKADLAMRRDSSVVDSLSGL